MLMDCPGLVCPEYVEKDAEIERLTMLNTAAKGIIHASGVENERLDNELHALKAATRRVVEAAQGYRECRGMLHGMELDAALADPVLVALRRE
jgi:hypothetical protein